VATAPVVQDDVVTRPAIRRGAAFVGASLALLSAAGGVLAFELFKESARSLPRLVLLISIVLPGAVAVAALVRINRLVVLGLLQGMFWPSVAWLTYDIDYSVQRPANYQYLSANAVGSLSDALGAAAAVLLLISWSPAISRRRGRLSGYLPAVMVCAVASAQITVLIFAVATYVPLAGRYELGIIDLLGGIAVAWYAVTIRDTALGAALVFGWAFSVGLPVFADRPPGTSGTAQISGTVACWLLGAVALLALMYSESAKTREQDQL
jgi:hypothetical protein